MIYRIPPHCQIHDLQIECELIKLIKYSILMKSVNTLTGLEAAGKKGWLSACPALGPRGVDPGHIFSDQATWGAFRA